MAIRELLRQAVEIFHIQPSEFWRMTMPEFLSLYASPKFRPKGPTREEVQELMKRFPDEVKK